jgi:hypothetical protein
MGKGMLAEEEEDAAEAWANVGVEATLEDFGGSRPAVSSCNASRRFIEDVSGRLRLSESKADVFGASAMTLSSPL